jgi:UDP-glucose 4-epimerase
MEPMKVLVCGGAGYIGSHTVVELTERGHDVLIFDNFCNSSRRVIDHLERVTGRRPYVVEGDIRDPVALRSAFSKFAPNAVIHFAALKSVAESTKEPLGYFDNNISGTINLLMTMQDYGVRRLVFSSSATVYGEADKCPITEDAPLRVTNPYGRSKLVMEELIGDLCNSDREFHAAILRYFNPVGAHSSGLLGEDPNGMPNNLLPYVSQVAIGSRPHLNVFGNDYQTPDGTGVRDYLHVMDLAKAHLSAIDFLSKEHRSLTVNLGTGRGYSVLEVVREFERASGRAIPLQFVPRRSGDVASCFADPGLARRTLGWKAEFGLARMCEDAWRWQASFPNGYESR